MREGLTGVGIFGQLECRNNLVERDVVHFCKVVADFAGVEVGADDFLGEMAKFCQPYDAVSVRDLTRVIQSIDGAIKAFSVGASGIEPGGVVAVDDSNAAYGFDAG